MTEPLIFDNFLPDPEAHRSEALKLEFRTYDFGHAVFHGIAVGGPCKAMLDAIQNFTLNFTPKLTFFRKSPVGQVEPHFIHTDVDMGDFSAILYLNPDPAPQDGTCFWTHLRTGEIQNTIPHLRSSEGNDPNQWIMRQRVLAKFNRLLMFPSSYFHSRSIHGNWGEGDGARLIQVAFGEERGAAL